MKKISVFAPATVANVACGFDALGFALHRPGDIVEAELTDGEQLRILEITFDDVKMPFDAETNTAGVAVKAMLTHLGSEQGISLRVHKRMPLGSGLGSSAASSVAALHAVNLLLGCPFEQRELVPFAMLAEAAACGAPHADNVAPGLLGGFVLVRSYDPLDVIPLDYPKELYCAILHPHIELRTEDARRILRRQIRLSDAVAQWSNLAGLIAGLSRQDYGLISRSLNDFIFEPVRSLLIPGFDRVKDAALQTGALGCSISGSGPSIFALCVSEDQAQRVASAMQQSLSSLELESDVLISAINPEGPGIWEGPLPDHLM